MPRKLTPGQRRARTILKKNPNFYRDIGRKAGKKTQELHPEVANFRDPDFAREAGLKGLQSQGKKD